MTTLLILGTVALTYWLTKDLDYLDNSNLDKDLFVNDEGIFDEDSWRKVTKPRY